ncbi:MAG: hypothetical protein GW858_05375 [Sphingomonadales bacterium]|nr:hypothetical protein [Sphingomonadales bacterium]NCQ21324.1 hypothetical protein [Sphingomonadales bacterium]
MLIPNMPGSPSPEQDPSADAKHNADAERSPKGQARFATYDPNQTSKKRKKRKGISPNPMNRHYSFPTPPTLQTSGRFRNHATEA